MVKYITHKHMSCNDTIHVGLNSRRSTTKTWGIPLALNLTVMFGESKSDVDGFLGIHSSTIVIDDREQKEIVIREALKRNLQSTF